MQTTVLIMKRQVLAQGLMHAARDNSGLIICYESDYAKADILIRETEAGTALIEIPENGRYDIDYCLGLCEWLRQETPGCKLILLCPTEKADAIEKAIDAKRIGVIDDFVFYDSGIKYLLSKLLSFRGS